jgi:hypothetical protein
MISVHIIHKVFYWLDAIRGMIDIVFLIGHVTNKLLNIYFGVSWFPRANKKSGYTEIDTTRLEYNEHGYNAFMAISNPSR